MERKGGRTRRMGSRTTHAGSAPDGSFDTLAAASRCRYAAVRCMQFRKSAMTPTTMRGNHADAGALSMDDDMFRTHSRPVTSAADPADAGRTRIQRRLVEIQQDLDDIGPTFGMQARRAALTREKNELLDQLLLLRSVA